MSRFLIAALLTIVPLTAEAQTKLGWCRMDGVNGGNITRGAVVRVCQGGEAAAIDRATDAAVGFSQDAAQPLCPPVDVAVAEARCAAAGTHFDPEAVPTVQFTRSDGQVRQERQAIAVRKVGQQGTCIFSRVVGETTGTNGTCQVLFVSWPRVEAEVLVRSYCGFVCR